MKPNILFIVVDCLRADHVYGEKAHIPTIKRLMKNGYSFLNAISSTSTTTPSFASMLTGLYPFENGVRSHSGYSLKKNTESIAKMLKKDVYHTYAEVTGPLVKETGLFDDFDEHNYREKDSKGIHGQWGQTLIEKFRKKYKEPWFILLHVFELHEPRKVPDCCKNKKCGNTLYARALSGIDQYLGRLLDAAGDNTLVILTGDHGEQIEKSSFEKNWKKCYGTFFKKLKKYNLTKTHFSVGMRNFHIGHGYSIYDGLVKIPLVFCCSKSVPRGSSKLQVRQVDITPTIVDLAGVTGNYRFSGKTLLPIMNEKEKSSRDAYLEAVGIVIPKKEDWLAGIRVDNKYKYIYSPFNRNFREELYDLEKDPEEKANIADKNKEIVKMLRKKIGKLKTEKMLGEKIEEKDQEIMLKRLKALGYFE